MNKRTISLRMAAALLTLLLIMPGWADVWGQTFTENREHSLVICEAGNVISFGNNALNVSLDKAQTVQLPSPFPRPCRARPMPWPWPLVQVIV
jgi:hypothetical protein